MDQHAADALQPFLDRLREALSAVANGDPAPVKALCSHTDANTVACVECAGQMIP
jgi:hypothetical protein